MKSKIEEFEKITKPLVQWLRENGDPYMTIVITDSFAKLKSDEFGIPFKHNKK